jgi:hypothetical protein
MDHRGDLSRSRSRWRWRWRWGWETSSISSTLNVTLDPGQVLFSMLDNT